MEGRAPREENTEQAPFCRIQRCPPEDTERQKELLRELFGKIGENIEIFPPVYCDYGKNIEIGENFFASYNFTVIDVAKVKIGDNVMIAANTTISSAGHPIHWEPRNAGYEYGIEVTIGNNVWIGANCWIIPECISETRSHRLRQRRDEGYPRQCGGCGKSVPRDASDNRRGQAVLLQEETLRRG